jgi:cellulose synthase (UDP-forming)
LTLVIYSDVREWYSQNREYADQPFSSLGFLATSLTRSLRDMKSTQTKKVRKQVQAHGQIYWDGHFFPGVATELGVTGLRLELNSKRAVSSDKTLTQQDLQSMQKSKPLVGLLLSQEAAPASPNRFVAEITSVIETGNGLAIEMNFPEKFRERQSTKIKQLLQAL